MQPLVHTGQLMAMHDTANLLLIDARARAHAFELFIAGHLSGAKYVHLDSKPEIINSDQGSQFTSDEYIEYVKSLETVKISMDGKRRATDNAFILRFFRTIKYDKIYLEMPENGTELHKVCEQFIHFYNEKREHSELGYNPPAERYLAAA